MAPRHARPRGVQESVPPSVKRELIATNAALCPTGSLAGCLKPSLPPGLLRACHGPSSQPCRVT